MSRSGSVIDVERCGPAALAAHHRPHMPLVAIALTSAGLLAYEVLLTRLFSIIQWHHFAYMVISIALLGYGASGTFLAVAQDRLRLRFTSVFALCAALFAVSAVAGFVVAQRLPFNALAVIWEPSQLLYLLALYLLFTVPFACGATCIGLALAVYRSDMLGARRCARDCCRVVRAVGLAGASGPRAS